MKTAPVVIGVAALHTVMLCVASVPAQAKSPFATKVVASNTNNNAGGGVFKPQNALGAPLGGGLFAGGTHVHSLGVGGSLTLGFDVTITDGPGADLVVFENPFLTGSGSRVFAEAIHVEVSSDGKQFARFPSDYYGPSTSGGAFAVSTVNMFRGLAGVCPVLAGSASHPKADPQDVVTGGGDAFDLADLGNHPLVVQGKVKLGAIRFVRLVDVVAGKDRDSQGRVIQDPGSGSADVDAVVAIHHTGNLSAKGPRVDLSLTKAGALTLTFSDPDGLHDLDVQSLRMALDCRELSPTVVLPLMQVQRASSTSLTLGLTGLPAGWGFRFAVSIRDKAGHRSGASRVRPL
jgi:hypothetical protein